MRKLIIILLVLPMWIFGQTNTVLKPPISANTLGGLESNQFVQTADPLSVTAEGTANQIMQFNGDGTMSPVNNAASAGVISFDATNLDAVKIFRVNDTTTESWAHSHNDYMLTFTKAYGTMGFADSSFSIPMTQNIYYPITNTANNLYITGVNYGLTFAGDSIQVPEDGDYEIEWDLSYSGANTDLYHIEIFVDGVSSKGKGEGQRDMSSSNIGSSSGHTILSLTALQWITLRIENTINNNDATVYAGNIVINKK